MEWVETTGRTVDEAKDAALDQLGVDESDAEFVVVSEPRPGLFGRMRGEARVRARVQPTSPRPKRGRTRRPAQERRAGQRQGRASGASSAPVALVEDDRSGAPADQAPTDEPSGNGSRPSPSAAQGKTSSGSRNRRRRSRGGAGNRSSGDGAGSGQGAKQTERATPPGRGSAVSDTQEAQSGMTLSLEEQGESARAFMAGLIDEMGLDAAVTVRLVDESTAEVAVDGSELGILIGPGGATLAALQELTRTVVQKQTGGHSERILVDVAGYRARRAEALQRFTTQIAGEVLESGTERALEPMSAADRKVVHDTVNEMAGVETRSEGEDPRRYIVISPTGAAAESADAG
jgi:spoIIIJ-associated protein